MVSVSSEQKDAYCKIKLQVDRKLLPVQMSMAITLERSQSKTVAGTNVNCHRPSR